MLGQGGTQRPLVTSLGPTQGRWLPRLELILLEIFQVLLFLPSFAWMLSEMPSASQEVPAELTPSCSRKALIHQALSIFSLFFLFFFRGH